ncbi:MAG: InlB B-repeat-containing protein, partial [Clostridia bacterium]|nr:InlB B-repeat-containing protein [Clostridia bacterium]
MPVSAAGEYSLYVHYMTGAYNIGTPSGIYRYDAIRGDEHPVIIPPGTSNTEILRQFENNTHHGTVSVGDTPTIAEPFRLLGYTFDGWYYNLDFTNTRDPYASATKYTGTLTNSMVSDGIIDLYAKWSLYASPDITSDSVSFTLQNDAEEYVNDPIMWTNADGSNPSKEIDFQSDVTDYYGYVYGDVSRLKLAFEQYDPGRVEI